LIIGRKKKKSLTPEQAANPQSVRVTAVAMLAARDFASGDLQEKLTAQGYAP